MNETSASELASPHEIPAHMVLPLACACSCIVLIRVVLVYVRLGSKEFGAFRLDHLVRLGGCL